MDKSLVFFVVYDPSNDLKHRSHTRASCKHENALVLQKDKGMVGHVRVWVFTNILIKTVLGLYLKSPRGPRINKESPGDNSNINLFMIVPGAVFAIPFQMIRKDERKVKGKKAIAKNEPELKKHNNPDRRGK